MGGLASKLAVWALGKMAKGATKEAGEVIAKDAAVSLGESAVKTAVKESTEAAAKGATKEAAETTAKSAAKEAAKETSEEATKKSAKGGFWYSTFHAGAETIKFGGNALLKHPVLTVGGTIGAWSALESAVGEKNFMDNTKENSAQVATRALEFGKGVIGGTVAAVTGDKDVQNVTKTAVETGKEVTQTVKATASRAADAVGGVGGTLKGVVDVIGGIFGGAANMLSNLTNGKVGGLGVVGLLASAYLIFGRTGILGKIGGLLMGMTLLSGIMRPSESVSAAQSVAQQRGKNDTIDLAETAPQQAMRR